MSSRSVQCVYAWVCISLCKISTRGLLIEQFVLWWPAHAHKSSRKQDKYHRARPANPSLLFLPLVKRVTKFHPPIREPPTSNYPTPILTPYLKLWQRAEESQTEENSLLCSFNSTTRRL